MKQAGAALPRRFLNRKTLRLTGGLEFLLWRTCI